MAQRIEIVRALKRMLRASRVWWDWTEGRGREECLQNDGVRRREGRRREERRQIGG